MVMQHLMSLSDALVWLFALPFAFSVAEEKADPPYNRLTEVKHFKTVVDVLVDQTIEGFLEINQEN